MMIPYMMDQFRQSQAAQVAPAEPRPVRSIEFKRTVQWQNYHGTEPRLATFFASFYGRLDAEGLYSVRLVRVQGSEVSFGRQDALNFEQPVPAWEAEAKAHLAEVVA